MREIRQSGSEGGGAESNHLSLPLYILTPLPRLGGEFGEPPLLDSFMQERYCPRL
jgi:hypothetical protein